MILQQLADYARLRVEQAKQQLPFEVLKERALALPGSGNRFVQALEQPGLSFICEVKKASPSKGIIDPEFRYLDIAKAYETAGADCISCLTEPKWFLGSDEIFTQIRAETKIPMLRKDFTVDEYQLYEAKCMGADAVLLICALLDTRTIARYLELCATLGLSVLVEAHNEQEVASAIQAGAAVVGVNNRNLKDFSVDFSNASRLREQIPTGVLFVAESGVTSAEDVAALRRTGADAVLVGEYLMRAEDKAGRLQEMRRNAE